MNASPLTKIAIALSLGLIIISLAFAVSRKNNNKAVSSKEALSETVKTALAKSLSDDTDGDGLKNWEEILYKTDNSNSDTDGDGVPDGIEVKNHADPTISGTGVGFQTIDDLNPYATSTTATKKLTATDKFSQTIISKYIEAKQSGQVLDEETLGNITDSVIFGNYTPSRIDFSVPSKLISEDISTISLKTYGNTFAKIISVPPPSGVPHETDIMNAIASNGLSPENKKNLEKISLRYKNIRQAISIILVPNIMVEGHELFIRGLDRIMDGVIGSINFDTDPIGAYIAVNSYGEGMDIMTKGVMLMKTEFKKAGIYFSPQEAGRLITE